MMLVVSSPPVADSPVASRLSVDEEEEEDRGAQTLPSPEASASAVSIAIAAANTSTTHNTPTDPTPSHHDNNMIDHQEQHTDVRSMLRHMSADQVAAELQSRNRRTFDAAVRSRQQDILQEMAREQYHVTYADEPTRTILGCSHYQRKNKLLAPCCGIFVTCRLCHDEKMPDNHIMERRDVRTVLCMVCGLEQDVGPKCINPDCPVDDFADYFCAVCRLYDSSGQAVYHCDDCGMCRKGTRMENSHCHTCNACVNVESIDRHRCMPQSLHVDCPICKEFLFTSRRPVVFMRCGHTMHSDCWHVYTSTKYTCPLCQKSLTSMESYYRELDRIMVTELANLPANLRQRKHRIYCNDCERLSEAPFHFEFHRCNLPIESSSRICGSYNTRVV